MVSAREIAHGRWQLDQLLGTMPCGCTYLLGTVGRLVERQTKACQAHDKHRDELGELRGV